MNAHAIARRGGLRASFCMFAAMALSVPVYAQYASSQASSAAASPGNVSGMDMADDAHFGKVLVDQLEATRTDGSNGHAWDAYAWYGSDFNKLALRTEGDRADGRVATGDIESLWSHAISAFWNTELGLRSDFSNDPERNWAAFGVQGIAPYWFHIEVTGYVGSGGRAAARLKAEYELLITQRLVLQPEIETNLYSRSDPANRLGSGIADTSVGVVWRRAYGGTADLRRADDLSVIDRQFVAGVRIWF